MKVRGGNAFLVTEKGFRIRSCYLKAKIRYDEFVKSHRPIGATSEEYQKWNDWCAYWYGALADNKERAIEQALIRKRKEKACRRHKRSPSHRRTNQITSLQSD